MITTFFLAHLCHLILDKSFIEHLYINHFSKHCASIYFLNVTAIYELGVFIAISSINPHFTEEKTEDKRD